ncbi:hypothetical protein [Leifsonia sp. EB34]|uniref:hypothetical protein n=1 Tax=Leifsonia sp. EB34 TaxID=3156303 RepID=UPI003518E6F6
MNRRSWVLPWTSTSALLFGVFAVITAFALPPKTGGIGVEPLIIGIVLIGAGVVGFVIFARHRRGRG